MKTLGLIVVLSAGVLVMLLTLVPIGVVTTLKAYPERGEIVKGNLRVAEVTVTNNGVFTRSVNLPELVACVGDEQVQLDSWTGTGNELVKGAGQLRVIEVRPHEQGTVYLVASETTPYDKLSVYYRTQYFSCLNPGTPVTS